MGPMSMGNRPDLPDFAIPAFGRHPSKAGRFQLKMFTARAVTRATVIKETRAWHSIKSLAR